MSYDIRIWTTLEPKNQNLVEAGHSPKTVAEGRGWLVNSSGSMQVADEDVPLEIANALPGIAYRVELNLEPYDAPALGRTKLLRLAKQIATECHGVVEDPQQDSMTLGTRVRRLSPLGSSDEATLLSMGFWYESGSMTRPDAAGNLLDVLSQHLPEAIPQRYGEFEPPQFRIQREGRKHLVAFMRQHWCETAVYYPAAPVAHFHISQPEEIGPSPRGYRSGRLCIDVDVDALEQPGWHLALTRAWRELVRFVQPFYADVRHLKHYERARGRYWIASTTDHHPICSWWWSGVPTGSVYAVALGDPYIELWPEFGISAERIDTVLGRMALDWRAGAPSLKQPTVPPSIEQPQPEFHINPDRRYPAVWPFAAPRSKR
jgi:hypothetical protein